MKHGLRLAVWTSMDAAGYVVCARIGTLRCLTPLSFCFRSSTGSAYMHKDISDFRRHHLVIWHCLTPSYSNHPPPPTAVNTNRLHHTTLMYFAISYRSRACFRRTLDANLFQLLYVRAIHRSTSASISQLAGAIRWSTHPWNGASTSSLVCTRTI